MTAVINALQFIINILYNLPGDPIAKWLSENSDIFAQFQEQFSIVNYFVPLNIMFPIFVSWLGILPALIVIMIVIKFFL